MAEVTKESLHALVRSLSTRKAEDVEKVLVHLLDTARNRWNKKAAEALRQLKDKDLEAEAIEEIKQTYKHAFEQSHRLSQMRYGIAKPKRPLGGATATATKPVQESGDAGKS